MLDELGTTIGAYLGQVLPAGTSVRQAPPSDTWKDQDSGIVSLFLHRVQASGGDGSAGLWTEERAPDGRVVSRTSPEQRYDFCYLVTAWSTDSELEFGLLGAILRAVANAPLVPA
ncbi:MAG TPA: Pvc16 family protein, partial [Kribbella sp.]|uniref:Pvc16 family protein n=1 Tax=Kribbella sp. TaxID=1871183 RepID=UPI002D783541